MAKDTIKIGSFVFRKVKAAGECRKGKLAVPVGEEDGIPLVKEYKPKTMVVFRVWPSGKVVALFPCQILWYRQAYTTQYEWLKYGPACKSMVKCAPSAALYRAKLSLTRPATPEEARDLADELKDLGYNLTVRQRAPSAAYKEKWLAMGND